jgi:hypothetical protein
MQKQKSGLTFALTVLASACGPKHAGKLAIALLTLLIYHSSIIAKAESCPSTKDEISTDRPDVTNSSLVVPAGSLQIENGINSSARDGGRFVDGTNTRLRLGIAQCLELLVDAPTYFANVHGPGNSGFSDVAPALKWQISPIPGKVDLSAVFGVALPTGAASIAGRGAQPYLQFPWSWELQRGWGLSGLFTEFIRPSDPTSKLITEATFVIEKKLSERAKAYYNGIRTHRSLDKDAPISRPVQRTGVISSRAILGGLHHHYARV